MFKMIKISLVLAVAACAFASIATPAMALKEFQAKAAPVNLKDINKGIHVFETGGLANVECATVESGGKAETQKATQIKIPVKYTKCEVKAFGFKFPAEVSEAKYAFKPDGTVSVENSIEIKVPLEKCVIKVTPQGNANLKAVSYTNIVTQTGTEVEVKAAVEGITQTTTGGTNCGKSSKEGKYTGTSLESAEKGSVAVF